MLTKLTICTCLGISTGLLCFGEHPALEDELKPPEVDQVIAFSNNPNFQYNSGDIYQELSKKRFLEFLKQGKPISIKTKPDDPKLHGHVTFHEPLLPWQRDQIRFEFKNGGTGESLLRCQGAAATRAAIFFWELFNDQVLWIGNEKGDGCFLRID